MSRPSAALAADDARLAPPASGDRDAGSGKGLLPAAM